MRAIVASASSATSSGSRPRPRSESDSARFKIDDDVLDVERLST